VTYMTSRWLNDAVCDYNVVNCIYCEMLAVWTVLHSW